MLKLHFQWWQFEIADVSDATNYFYLVANQVRANFNIMTALKQWVSKQEK